MMWFIKNLVVDWMPAETAVAVFCFVFAALFLDLEGRDLTLNWRKREVGLA